jgi:hypothetical protein
MARFWDSAEGKNPDRVDMAGTLEQVSKLPSLGDLPLVALSHNGISDLFSVGLPGVLETKLERMWLEMVTEQSKLSTNGSLVVASKPSHSIHVSEPQLVIDAILKVVEEARKRAQ